MAGTRKEEVVPILALGREGVLPVLPRRERAVPVLLLRRHRDLPLRLRTKMRYWSNAPRSAPALLAPRSGRAARPRQPPQATATSVRSGVPKKQHGIQEKILTCQRP